MTTRTKLLATALFLTACASLTVALARLPTSTFASRWGLLPSGVRSSPADEERGRLRSGYRMGSRSYMLGRCAVWSERELCIWDEAKI